jgi:acetyl esterase/lipase
MAGMKWAMGIYSNGLDPSHPSLSPIFGDLSGLPPILIQAGDSEVVTDDAILLFQLASKAGNAVELQLFKDMFHVFPTFPFLPQSAAALSRVGKFVKFQTSRSDSGVSLEAASEKFNYIENLSVSIDRYDAETRLKIKQ